MELGREDKVEEILSLLNLNLADWTHQCQTKREVSPDRQLTAI